MMGQAFWRFLLKRTLPPDYLSTCKFAVFGLGDSSYPKYNVVAKKLDVRLGALGGQRLCARGLGDEQNPNGYLNELDPWSDQLWQRLETLFPLSSPLNIAPLALPPPRHEVLLMPCDTSRDWHDDILVSGSLHSTGPTWSRGHPFYAEVTENRRITAEDHWQDVRHIELDLGDSAITYEPGDVLCIQPRNLPDVSEAFLKLLGLDHNTVVRFSRTDSTREPVTCSLQEVAERYLDFQASPKRSLFELLSFFASAEREKERLSYFASAEGTDDMYDYNYRSKRTICEVFRDFPSLRVPLPYLLDLIPRINPRYFSIASSLHVCPGQVQITAAIVNYTTPLNHTRVGVCTSWLSSLNRGDRLPVWVKAGALQLPADPSSPIIMVGPGTGCAPFHSFCQERLWLRSQGVDVGPAMLFFGCRYENKDFLYGSEWKELLGQEEDIFVCAFSRQSADQKVYVQDKIAEFRDLIWQRLFLRGATLYISGAAKRMPPAVRDAVVGVASSVGRLSSEDAEMAVRTLEQQKRLQMETWS
mmetsp:Transcript_40612/g.65890  ORF Transcript_40612/g.65890 Transcript_40612/m.65890 type:complete len:529 (+) Transcript_40612:173-1759(+)